MRKFVLERRWKWWGDTPKFCHESIKTLKQKTIVLVFSCFNALVSLVQREHGHNHAGNHYNIYNNPNCFSGALFHITMVIELRIYTNITNVPIVILISYYSRTFAYSLTVSHFDNILI